MTRWSLRSLVLALTFFILGVTSSVFGQLRNYHYLNGQCPAHSCAQVSIGGCTFQGSGLTVDFCTQTGGSGCTENQLDLTAPTCGIGVDPLGAPCAPFAYEC